MRSYDENHRSVVKFKNDIQNAQKNILAYFPSDDKTPTIWHKKLLIFNAMIQKELINFDFDTDEEISELISHLKSKVNETFEENTSFCKVLGYVLDWYSLKLSDVMVEKKEEEILYKTKDKIQKEEEIERERLIKRVQEIKKDVTIFNNLLRKTHKNYQIIDLHLDQDEEKVFQALIQEENYFEWMVDNSELVLNYKKNVDILTNRLVVLKEEVRKVSEAFLKKQTISSLKRLEKINDKLGKKNDYKVDVYYLKEFLESKNPLHQNIIEKYRRIQEKNISYLKICEIKKETDKLEQNLNVLIANIQTYYQSDTYYEWAYKLIWPSVVDLAVSKIYDDLKKMTSHFAHESKSLQVMRHMKEPYEVIQQDVPQFNTIVENEFVEIASAFTKALYEKSKSHEELKKWELEARTAQEKEKNNFLLPIRIEVDVEDIDPLCFKELHRRELDHAWNDGFKKIFTVQTKKISDDFQKVNIHDTNAFHKIKDLEGELYAIKNKISRDLGAIQKEENRNRIESFLSQIFSELDILNNIKKFLADFSESKYESKYESKPEKPQKLIEEDFPLYEPSPSRKRSFLSFFRSMWNGIRGFFSRIFCCFSFCRELRRPPSQDRKSLNGSYKKLLTSEVGRHSHPSVILDKAQIVSTLTPNPSPLPKSAPGEGNSPLVIPSTACGRGVGVRVYSPAQSLTS